MAVAEIDRVQIKYEVNGEGPALVFLHCWTGNTVFYRKQVRYFSPHYRCICLDFPGHGGSGKCEDYSVEHFADLTVELLDRLGVKEAVFAGHSLGGMVCQYLALERPDMVKGIVLLDTTSHLSGFFIQKVVAATAVRLGRLGFRAGKAAVAGLAAVHPISGIAPRVLTMKECSRIKNDPMVKTLDSVRNFNATDRLCDIKQPALVIVGAADLLADVRHAKVLARGIPNSTLKVVHWAGHMALFEEPEVVNKAMEDFLNRVYPPRGKSKKKTAS